MYATILVPLDESARAEKILPHVEQMARSFGSNVILLRVVEPIVAVSSADVFVPATDSFSAKLEQAQVYLNDLKKKASGKADRCGTARDRQHDRRCHL